MALAIGVVSELPCSIIVTVVAMENSNAAMMNASSRPAFRTTIVRANNRATTAIAASTVIASVTPMTAEPGACPDIAILLKCLEATESSKREVSFQTDLLLEGPAAEFQILLYNRRCIEATIGALSYFIA